MTSRAAVVIGVDRTGGLQPLEGAASGAEDISKWFEAEGYEVVCLTDANDGTVELSQISKAVRDFVNRGTIEKLVIYFSGHGYLNGLAEVWMLSGAPDDANEAVDQQESIEFARTSNIPNVIFISDTCRSTPQTFDANRMRGGSIFPNRQPGNNDPEIDRFYATRPGDPAVELSEDEAREIYKGLFTEVLKEAHARPDPEDLTDGEIDGVAVKVVTNRRLKDCLPVRFTQVAENIDRRIKQKPQLRLECGEKMFVARATAVQAAPRVAYRGSPPGGRPPEGLSRFQRRMPERRQAGPAAATLEQTAHKMLTETSDYRLRGGNASIKYRGGGGDVTPAAESFLEATQRLAADVEPQSFETRTGIRIAGSVALRAVGIDTRATVLDFPDDGRPDHTPRTLIRVHHADHEYSDPEGPGSVLVQFEEGTAAIIATIPDYVAQVSCETGRVANISYVPAQNSDLWADYEHQAVQINELRAAAAAAARMGVFATDKEAAEDFAGRVRIGKRHDPTLGLYAALAYAEVGQRKGIQSILGYMQDDIEAALYDVWLLAGAEPSATKRIPICPMLTQSWSYLRPRGVSLEAFAGLDRENALWTTFSQKAAQRLFELAEQGKLK